MDTDVLLVVACGYVVGLLVWPWRRYLGGADPDGPIDWRPLWALMFACVWPYLLIILAAEAYERVQRWHFRRQRRR